VLTGEHTPFPDKEREMPPEDANVKANLFAHFSPATMSVRKSQSRFRNFIDLPVGDSSRKAAASPAYLFFLRLSP
jgi:hypothetical protein